MVKRLSKNVEVGLSWNNWAIPLHIEACKPYTAFNPQTQDERWVAQVVITIFCFYLDARWFTTEVLQK
ncbi:hypothetical protein KKF82_04930 [Patescibacteria group bacterium]|nr:hypothetical protein [Patescibacteria group bacterium]